MDLKGPRQFDRPDDLPRDFLDISLESMGGHTLFGEVDEASMRDAAEFIIKSNQLFTTNRDLTLFVNTIGGNCADGFALIDLMQISRLPIRTVGLGNVISMGVLILSAGAKGKRMVTRNSMIMAHQFSDVVSGKFHEIMSAHKAELYLKHQFIEHFRRHSTMDDAQIEDIAFAKSDVWLTPAECKKYGLVDQVVDELPEFTVELPALRRSSRPRGGGSKRRPRK